jgi:hypothetical protein
MRGFLNKRPFKYLIYFTIIFICILKFPGVHDDWFFKMLLGIAILNLLFAIWFLKSNILLRIIPGLIIPNILIYISFLLFAKLPERFSTEFSFFTIFAIVSLVSWELYIALLKERLN